MNMGHLVGSLRKFTEETNAITMVTFFERRFNDPTGILRFATAVITLLFFTIYASSGLVAIGKLFETIFHMSFVPAVIFGAVVIISLIAAALACNPENTVLDLVAYAWGGWELHLAR